MTPGLAWYDVAGVAGVASIVVSYLLVQGRRLSATGVLYPAANAAGAGLVLLSLVFRFNLSAFLVEAFWVAISLYGVGRALRERQRSRREPGR